MTARRLAFAAVALLTAWMPAARAGDTLWLIHLQDDPALLFYHYALDAEPNGNNQYLHVVTPITKAALAPGAIGHQFVDATVFFAEPGADPTNCPPAIFPGADLMGCSEGLTIRWNADDTLEIWAISAGTFYDSDHYNIFRDNIVTGNVRTKVKQSAGSSADDVSDLFGLPFGSVEFDSMDLPVPEPSSIATLAAALALLALGRSGMVVRSVAACARAASRRHPSRPHVA